MKQFFSLMVLILPVLSGCATARLPQGPDIFSLKTFQSNPTVAVSKAVDLRDSDYAGAIGAAGVKVKEDIIDLTTNYVIETLNQRLELNVVMEGPITEETATKIISQKKADGAVVTEIQRLKLHSLDALMQPVEVDMDILVKVYDKKGIKLIEKSVLGHYEKRIGLTIVEKATGELVDNVVRDVAHNMSKDSDIKAAINKLT